MIEFWLICSSENTSHLANRYCRSLRVVFLPRDPKLVLIIETTNGPAGKVAILNGDMMMELKEKWNGGSGSSVPKKLGLQVQQTIRCMYL